MRLREYDWIWASRKVRIVLYGSGGEKGDLRIPPGNMQFASQTVEKLQNAAGFGFQDGFHDQLPTAIQDRDHNRFLVTSRPIYLMSRLI